MVKKALTTGQVSKICHVAPRTVCKWFDSGWLKGYRIPDSQDRRIPREDLIRFLKENGMPVEGAYHRILFIACDALFAGRLSKLLPENNGYKHELVHSGFDAGFIARDFYPDVIIIDLAIGRPDALQIVRDLRRTLQHQMTFIVALANENEALPEMLINFGFDEIFEKPFDCTLLAVRIQVFLEQ